MSNPQAIRTPAPEAGPEPRPGPILHSVAPPAPGGERAQVEMRPLAAVFADAALERMYRAEQVQMDAQQAFRVMLAVAVALLPISIADWGLFAGNGTFSLLLAVRLLFVGLSVATGLAAVRCHDPHRLDLLILYWAAMFVIVDLHSVSTRPPDALGHTMIHSALVILIYAGIPLPLLLQTLVGVAFSAVYLYIVYVSQPVLRYEALGSLALAMVAANLLGYLTSRRQQLAGRRLFAVLVHVERMRSEADRRSLTDALTGLVNRRGWNERLEAIEAQCRASGRGAAIVALDLDGLKAINDTLGHDRGDALIAGAAQCLREAARAGDTVARLGGDELAVLAVDCNGAGILALTRRIEECLAAAGIRASLGFAARGDAGGLQRAWQEADRAMYAHKERRRAGR
jgi:diguanylate cyclase (GGDEF)-like protein